jgi:hypothetical protein
MPPEQDTASGQTTTDPAAQTTAAAPAAGDTLLSADKPADAAAADAAKPNADTTTEQTDAEKQAAADAAKQAEEEAKANEVPEEYADFTLPDGVTIDTEVGGEFKTLAKELGLTQAKAQQVMDLGAKLVQKADAQRAEAMASEVSKWAEASRTDKEFGGDKLAENLAGAKKALSEFGSPELQTMLNESGLGNHPEVIRLLHRVSKAISEDKIVRGNATPGATDAAKSLYNNSQMN